MPSSDSASAATSTKQDGAVWFRSTDFGDDKDRVIFRSNGEPTYFAADIGYVTEKFSRGFDHLIYIWGADHHGTVARVRNAAAAMGYDQDAVEMKLYSWVRFVRDGREVSMSKRAGEFITLDDLLAEVGVDAARWFFASRATTTGIDFDIELAKKQSNENPVYYVQYAHARIASILRKATDVGARAGGSVAGTLGARPGGRPRPCDRPVPRGRRGCRRGRGDAGRDRLRDGAGDDVPRLLPRRARRRPRRAGAIGRAARARARGPGSRSRTRSRCSGSPRPRRCRAPPGGRPTPRDRGRRRPSRRVASSEPTTTQRVVPPVPGTTCATPPAVLSAVVAAVSNSAASASVSQTVCIATAHVSSGPSITARRSPPQPAAASAAAACATPPIRSHVPIWNSPNVS